jgi:hypothetical protein
MKSTSTFNDRKMKTYEQTCQIKKMNKVQIIIWKCSHIALVFREMQINTTRRYFYTSISMFKLKGITTTTKTTDNTKWCGKHRAKMMRRQTHGKYLAFIKKNKNLHLHKTCM